MISLYRSARPAHAAWNLLKTMASIALIWAIFVVGIPMAIIRGQLAEDMRLYFFPAMPRLAIAVAVLSVTITLWCAVLLAVWGRGTPLPFDATRRLVQTGPYRWIRNPLLVSGLLGGVAIALYEGASLIFPYIVVVTLLADLVVTAIEDHGHQRIFGRDYEAYRRTVRPWLPMRRPFKPRRTVGPVQYTELPGEGSRRSQPM